MDTIDTINAEPWSDNQAPPTYKRGVSIVAKRLLAWLDLCVHRHRSRMDLLELTEGQLADIGISRHEAHREGIKRFWE